MKKDSQIKKKNEKFFVNKTKFFFFDHKKIFSS